MCRPMNTSQLQFIHPQYKRGKVCALATSQDVSQESNSKHEGCESALCNAIFGVTHPDSVDFGLILS